MRNTRSIRKKDMIHNSLAPRIEVDPQNYQVRVDGKVITCEPAECPADGAALLPVLTGTQDKHRTRKSARVQSPEGKSGGSRSIRDGRRSGLRTLRSRTSRWLLLGEKSIVNPNQFQDHPTLGFVDWTLRGVGQVVFQNNPLSGLIILAALFLQFVDLRLDMHPRRGGQHRQPQSTLKADRGLIRDGLFGFNGALVALSLVAFTSENFRTGAVPSFYMTIYIAFAAALTTVAFSSIATLLAPHKVAALTMPFVFIGWLFLFAVLKFDSIDAGPLAKPVSPDQFPDGVAYVLPTWYMGIGNAIGQIFFQDNWISGYLILIGMAVNSRIGAGMALMGAALAALVAVIFGAPEGAIRDGLFGYNAALTAIALGGFFLVLTWQSFIYTVFGVIVTTWLWASVAIFLAPIGMPVLTSTFVIVTWTMLIGQYGFKALVPVPPAEATTPEDNRRRYIASLKR